MKFNKNYQRRIALTLSIVFLSVATMFAQDWAAGSGTVAPSTSPIQSCETVTIQGDYVWGSFSSLYINANHNATLSFAFPPGLQAGTGTATVYNNGVPVVGATIVPNATGVTASFLSVPGGLIVAPFGVLKFEVVGVEIKDDQSYSNQAAIHSMSFQANPPGNLISNDAFTGSSFNTTQVVLAATVTGVTPICPGSNAVFTISGTPGNTVEYNYNNGPSEPLATIGAGGTVDVMVTGATSTQVINLTQVNSGSCSQSISETFTINMGGTITNTVPVTACDSYTSPGGKMVTSSGTVKDTFPSSGPCDSVVTYNVTINNSNTGSSSETACDSYTWPANSMTYTSSGMYTATLTNAAGCDSVHTLNLTINNSNTGSSSETACDSYTWPANSMTYTSSGMYTATLTNAAGCDSVHTLNLTINQSNTGSSSETACDSYVFDNTPYTTSGVYTATFTNAAGCDSVHTLNLTINNSNTGSSSETACDSYTWPANSMTYTSSGMYTATLTNAAGCDSVHTLNLTINSSNTGSSSETACDSYVFDNTPYTTSGVYTATFTNAAGCDSVHTLTLTINSSNTGSSSETACDSYVFDNTPYTTSGVYTATFTNAAGCDSVHTLTLTINNSNTGSSSETACDSYVFDNTPYTTSGVYTATFTNAAGCDSVHTLNLTINNSNTGSSSETACDSYTWPANSMTYTSSGMYTATLTNAAGCDSVHTLNLTINQSNTGSSSETACDSYVFDNTPYTTSGVYTATFTNAAGCDSVHTLTLTINNSNTGSSSETACDSYVFDNTPYTTSGVYTATFTNAAGCDSVHTLTLTINSSNTGSSSETACDSYVFDNTPYTTSGVYTATFTNAAGCDSVHTLTLTINNSNTGSSSETACDSYVFDNTPYTTSGVYTATFTNAAGCDSVHTLTLTITATPATPTVSVTHPTCNGGSGTINVSAPLGAGLEYSIDQVNYQASPNFSAVAGTYNVTVRDNVNTACESAAASATLNPSTNICGPNVAVGAQATPNAIAEAGTANVSYFVSNVGTSPTTGAINIIITKPANGTLTVTAPSGWTITSNTSSSVIMTTNNVILPGLINGETISAVYVHDGTNEDAVKLSNIKAQAGSGGETITNDNEGQTYIQIN